MRLWCKAGRPLVIDSIANVVQKNLQLHRKEKKLPAPSCGSTMKSNTACTAKSILARSKRLLEYFLRATIEV
jgi:hypothetical protein